MAVLTENIKLLCNTMINFYYDNKYGIETRKQVQVYDLGIYDENINHAKRYQAINYYRLRRVFKYIEVDFSKYNFYDIGAGKGRAVFYASQLPFKKCIGVEVGDNVFTDSINNLNSYKLDSSKLQFLKQDASLVEYEQGPNIYFLYNPFDEVIMRNFLNGVNKSFHKDDLIVYVNPRKTDYFVEFGWVRYKKVMNKNFNRVIYLYKRKSEVV